MGNAAFHSAFLQEVLQAAIPALVALLRDGNEKSRANAAGALGNFGRHSGQFCSVLVRARRLEVAGCSVRYGRVTCVALGPCGMVVRFSWDLCVQLSSGCLEGLVDTVANDVALSPKRVALFSLGTLMVYRPFRSAAVVRSG